MRSERTPAAELCTDLPFFIADVPVVWLFSLISMIDEMGSEEIWGEEKQPMEKAKATSEWEGREKNVKCLRCKSSARRRDRMKEHYQPSSSINLISSGWKKREKERKFQRTAGRESERRVEEIHPLARCEGREETRKLLVLSLPPTNQRCEIFFHPSLWHVRER